MWRRGLLIRRHGLFWGPGYYDYRYARWRHVHGYYHYSECENDAPQAQLPPNSANFLFVPMTATQLPNCGFNRIQPQEFSSIMNGIRDADLNAPDPPCCSSLLCCCLIPGFGWCYYCSEKENQKKTLVKDSIIRKCQQVTADLAPRGITVQFLEFDDGSRGIVFEVSPFLANGAPNNAWTGAVPVLDAATKKAMAMDQNMLRGIQVSDAQLPEYDEAYAQSAQMLNQVQGSHENIKGLAHRFVVADWFATNNLAAFGPVAQDCKVAFEGACKLMGLDPAPAFQQAQQDLKEYKGAEPGQVQQDVQAVNSAQDANAAKTVFEAAATRFIEASALPPPPAYNPATFAPPGFQTESKAQAPAPIQAQQYIAPPTQYGDSSAPPMDVNAPQNLDQPLLGGNQSSDGPPAYGGM